MKFASKLVIAALAFSFVGAASPAQAAQTGDLTVKIHYARQAGDFTGRYAWVWLSGTNAAGTFTGAGVVTATGGAWIPVNNSGIDSYGAVSTFTLTGGKNIDKFGIIECSTNSWAAPNACVKDAASGVDRFITVSSLNSEVWLRSGSSQVADTTIYTLDSLAPYTATSQTVKVHYNRTDGNYAGWKLHLGTESKLMASTYWVSPADYDFTAANPVGYSVGTDQFGSFIQATLPYYAGQTKTINMVVYSLDANNAWVKDGGNVDGNRYLAADASGTTNVWLLSGDTTGTAAFATEPATPTPTATPTATATSVPAPVISGLNVSSASAGDEVTINGTDLQAGLDSPSVDVSGVAANVTSTNATSVSFTVPAGLSAGDNTVTLTTSSGTSNAVTLTILSSPNSGEPTIDSFSPVSAHAGDIVVISGSGLLDGVITIDGVATPVDAISGDTFISFAIPSDLVSGTHLITVTTAAGATSAGYTVLPAGPNIASITDLIGNPISQVQTGDLIVINGSNFSGISSVSFAGQDADLTTPETVLTDTSLTVTVPESVSGVVTVTTSGGTATSDPITFLNVLPPTIEVVDPASARAGDLVFIGGTHLLGSTVTIGGEAAAIVLTTTSLLTVTMPAGLPTGDAAVVVTAEGGSASSSISVLTSAPAITSVNVPNANIGDVVTLYGTDFADATEVSFNGVSADLTNPAFAISLDGTSISVVVPDGATSGFISVTTANGTGSFDGFTIGGPNPTDSPSPTDTPTPTDSPSPTDTPSPTDSPTPSAFPVISLLDPQAAQSGDVVTILGTDFGNNPVVTIGGLPAEVIDCGSYLQDGSGFWSPDFNQCSLSSLLVIVPDGIPVGAADVVVTWDNQTTAMSSLAIIAQPPTIDGLSDQSGKAGDVITIYGSQLTDVTSITFDGDGSFGPVNVDLADLNYVANPDGSSITFVVPNGATSGTITVTTFSGFVVSDDTFEIVPIPTIDSLSATSGIPGDVITIYGTNLDSILSVTFNGNEADLTDFNTVIAEDGSSISVTVPDTATTGYITVATSGGTATSADIFNLASGPEITSLSSLMGRSGATVSINGANLGGLESVSFDGDEDNQPVLADLSNPRTVITDSLVTVVVPDGVTSGTITLTTAGGVVTSDDVYEIVAGPVVTWMSATSLKPGSTLVMRGTGLAWAKVRIRGVLASTTESPTDTQIKVTVPQLGPGRTTLVITTPGGAITRQVTISTPAPIITSFTQSASKKRGVGTVVVTGRNLNGAVVRVGNIVVKVRPGSTATRLVFTLPKHAAVSKKGIFSITTDGGVAKSKAALKITAK